MHSRHIFRNQFAIPTTYQKKKKTIIIDIERYGKKSPECWALDTCILSIWCSNLRARARVHKHHICVVLIYILMIQFHQRLGATVVFRRRSLLALSAVLLVCFSCMPSAVPHSLADWCTALSFSRTADACAFFCYFFRCTRVWIDAGYHSFVFFFCSCCSRLIIVSPLFIYIVYICIYYSHFPLYIICGMAENI